LLMVAAPLIATFFTQPKLVWLTRLMALVLPLGALAAVPDALLTMRLQFRARAGAEVIASLCSGAVAVLLAWQGFGVWSLAWQAVIAIAIRGAMLWVFSGWRPRGHFRAASFQSLFGFGGYMLITGLLNTIAVRMQAILIGKFFDASQLGYYTLAQNTQQAPTSLMGSILTRVGLPVFSSIADDRQKLLAALRASLSMAMFLFVPCMVGIALIAKPLVELLYGARWVNAAPILTILALSAALWPIHVLNLAAIGAQGKSSLLLRVEVIKQLAVIGLIAVCSPGGPVAIAWAVFGGSIISVMINTHYSQKLLGYGALAQIMDQSATFALSAAAAIAGWAVLHWTNPSPITMVNALAASAAVYLLLAALTRNNALIGLLSLIRTLCAKPYAPRL
ncbi:MAG: lipopolysaccharide biosynthesis protein, partial [Gammaproteobacteria bacterium]